jgi:hypothetical protein
MKKNGMFFITLLVTVFFLFMAANWAMALPPKKGCGIGPVNHKITIKNNSKYTITLRATLDDLCENLKGDPAVVGYPPIGPGASVTINFDGSYGWYDENTRFIVDIIRATLGTKTCLSGAHTLFIARGDGWPVPRNGTYEIYTKGMQNYAGFSCD